MGGGRAKTHSPIYYRYARRVLCRPAWLACLYMSPAVADKVLEHYRNTRILKGRVASHGRFRHDGAAADTRRDGSARDGEPDAVLREFGGLDVAVGSDQVLMRRPPGARQ